MLQDGPCKGKIAAIVDVIDQNRVLIDGPCSEVPRQEYPIKNLHLTALKVSSKLLNVAIVCGLGYHRIILSNVQCKSSCQDMGWVVENGGIVYFLPGQNGGIPHIKVDPTPVQTSWLAMCIIL